MIVVIKISKIWRINIKDSIRGSRKEKTTQKTIYKSITVSEYTKCLRKVDRNEKC